MSVAQLGTRELEAAAAGQELGADFYASYLLALLCAGDVVNARFLWKRIPSQHTRFAPLLSREASRTQKRRNKRTTTATTKQRLCGLGLDVVVVLYLGADLLFLQQRYAEDCARGSGGFVEEEPQKPAHCSQGAG
jgi:hypothetical protein